MLLQELGEFIYATITFFYFLETKVSNKTYHWKTVKVRHLTYSVFQWAFVILV